MNSQNPTHHGLWIDETNSAAWAEGLRKEMLAWLAPLEGARSEEFGSFSIEVDPPSEDQARKARERNADLRGRIGLTWGQDRIELEVPMSYRGVFLSHRPESSRSLVSVWTSWLAEKPGFRIVTPTSGNKRSRGTKEWRLGLPSGRFLSGTLGKVAQALPADSYFGDPSVFPEWLQEDIAVIGLKGHKQGEAARRWSGLFQENESRFGDPIDQEDLGHRILMTFPVWLKHQVSRELLQFVLDRKEERLGSRILAVLKGSGEGNPSLAREAWRSVAAAAGPISRRLVVAVHNARSKDHADPVDPINSLDLAARITRVKRIHLPAGRLEEMPAEYRQNHPSFRGCLCPVDSPESGQVGLTLHLAVGAKVDLDGGIHPANEPALELSYGAGLVPFFANNDGARNMMGAKNLRQAEPVRGRQRPAVESGGETRLHEFVGGAVSIGACRESKDGDGTFALGRDLLVAYLPWEGLNFEDAVVLGKQVAKAGWLDATLSHAPVRKSIPVGWIPAGRNDEVLTAKDQGKGSSGEPACVGLAKIGSTLHTGDEIARFVCEGARGANPLVIRHQERHSVVLKSIRFSRRQPWTAGMLEYEVEAPVPIKPGDKLMGRHGNKGVVGAILSSDRMPRLPDDMSIPKHLRGRAIDILLNPHGVISRMNLGQMLETHLGWVLHAGDHRIGDLVKSDTQPGSLPAEAFATCLDHGKVRAALKATGLDEHGRVSLVLPDGTRTLSPVVVGYQHIVRLKHIPEMKSQARRGGKEALYSARTGQAVHGRRFGGGQRLGEMEEWALSAHGANEVIAEMLGVKSTAELAGAWEPGAEGPLVGVNGFSPLFRDWLLALRIELEPKDNGGSALGLVSEEKILQYAGPWGKASSPEGLTVSPAARFQCHEGGKRRPCMHELLGGAKIPFPHSSDGKENDKKSLRLDDLLAHLGLRISGPVWKSGGSYRLTLIEVKNGLETHPLELQMEPGSDFLKACAKPLPGERPAGWPESLEEVNLYGRFGGGEQGNFGGEELITEFQKPKDQRRRVGEMRIACPRHPSKVLFAVEPFKRVQYATPGGLCDPLIFGDSSIQPGEIQAVRWGYIELPVDVPYPLAAICPKTAKKAAAEGIEVPRIALIPILPARYRRPTVRGNTAHQDDLDRFGYAPLIRLCAAYLSAKAEDDQKHCAALATRIEAQVGDLFRRLASKLRGKSGLIRRHGLGRRVDRSARLVAIPNPYLAWDHVGLPAAVLLELMGDVVAAWKRHPKTMSTVGTIVSEQKQTAISSMSREDLEAAVAGLLTTWERGAHAEKDEVVLALLVRSSWRRAMGIPTVFNAAIELLQEFLDAHPNYVVLLNRQPSLHRDSVQAFHPVALPAEAGDVVQLCPLACKGFGLDFDGDEMAIHAPLSTAAQVEAARLRPSKNLFSMANRGVDGVLAHFDQDFVLGTWWIGVDPTGDLRTRLVDLLPSEDCRALVPAAGPISKDAGQKLLHHLAIHHSERAPVVVAAWMRLAFEACTRLGVSFGHFELLDLAEQLRGDAELALKQQDSESNAMLDKLALDILEPILTAPVQMDRPGLHVAAMTLSGARGKKQVRQLIAARGWLDPGATCFDREASRARFRIATSLAVGMTPDEAFWAAMNARSSMCDKKLGTGHAGGLTRHLVFALRSQAIVSADCGNEIEGGARTLTMCRESKGFCAKCYGTLPGGELPEVGYQVGLIAAQSIGERGTQLSMQSFHAGKKEIDIKQVRRLLGLTGKSEFSFQDRGEAPGFVARLREANAYRDLDERHLDLTWTVLHRAANVLEGSGNTETISLKTVVSMGSTLDKLAYRDPDEILAHAVLEEVLIEDGSPLAKLIL